MDIKTQVLQYRYQLAIIAVSVSAIVTSVLYAAPRIGTIVAFFLPLIASTALFVTAIAAFSAFSYLTVDHIHGGQNPGENIMDYVARQNEYTADEDNHGT